MEMVTLLAIGELMLKFGIPAALNITAAWHSNISGEPSPKDIEKLRLMVPEPTMESFFGD